MLDEKLAIGTPQAFLEGIDGPLNLMSTDRLLDDLSKIDGKTAHANHASEPCEHRVIAQAHVIAECLQVVVTLEALAALKLAQWIQLLLSPGSGTSIIVIGQNHKT